MGRLQIFKGFAGSFSTSLSRDVGHNQIKLCRCGIRYTWKALGLYIYNDCIYNECIKLESRKLDTLLVSIFWYESKSHLNLGASTPTVAVALFFYLPLDTPILVHLS